MRLQRGAAQPGSRLGPQALGPPVCRHCTKVLVGATVLVVILRAPLWQEASLELQKGFQEERLHLSAQEGDTRRRATMGLCQSALQCLQSDTKMNVAG